jgi:hypothetical protein
LHGRDSFQKNNTHGQSCFPANTCGKAAKPESCGTAPAKRGGAISQTARAPRFEQL